MKINNIIAVAIVALVTVVAANARHDVKHNPVPENVKKLYVFLGNWKGKATVKGAKASGAGSVSHRS